MTDEPKPLPITDEELGELLFAQRADGPPEGDGAVTVWALAWFPKDEWARAIELWPELLDTMPADHDAYSKQVESHLKDAAAREPGTPDVAPLNVDALIETYGEDAGEPLSRASMGANIARSGNAIAWPPSRNDACWCGSGRKYKQCCGPVAAAQD